MFTLTSFICFLHYIAVEFVQKCCVSSAWEYDRQTMLLIRSSMVECGGVCTRSCPGAFSAPFICPSAPVTCYGEGLLGRKKKRWRRRGKRAGRQVHFKRLPKLGLFYDGSRPSYLCSVFPDAPRVLVPLPRSKPTSGRGVRSLPQASPSTSGIVSAPFKMALINAHSISNKSFLLSDLFTSKNLDFMLLTETWQRSMEYCHLIKVCPVDCSFISTPRLTGHTGGLPVAFKKHFICQSWW